MLKRAYISEKSMDLAKGGLYTFEVSKDATKEAIAKLIKSKFSVDVKSVSTINISGKTKLQRSRRGYFKTSPIKKALVRVGKGQKIPLFEVAAEPETQVVTAETPIKEKKNLLKGTKVKVESVKKEEKAKKETKVVSTKKKSIMKKKGAK